MMKIFGIREENGSRRQKVQLLSKRQSTFVSTFYWLIQPNNSKLDRCHHTERIESIHLFYKQTHFFSRNHTNGKLSSGH